MMTGSLAPRRRVRLLALDIDGTVTGSDHRVSAAARDAVARVIGAGVRVMLATGRRYRDALPIARELGVDVPLVSASGALVKRPSDHATLAKAAFASGVVEGLVRFVAARGHEPIVYTDSFADGFDFHCRSLAQAAAEPGEFGSGGLAEYLGRNRDVAAIKPDLHVAPPAGVFAAFTMGPREQMASLEADLADAFPGELSLHTIKSPRYRDWMCEIAPVGVTKWSGIAAVAAGWGIEATEICAVGDDVNDVPMIRAAGLGVAMGNARPEVQAEADIVVATNDQGGLADVAELVLAGIA